MFVRACRYSLPRAVRGVSLARHSGSNNSFFINVSSNSSSPVKRWKSTPSYMEEVGEVVEFPASDADSTPVLLNSKEHAIGYLSKILNARVYEAAIETDLQRAENLSAVSIEQKVFSSGSGS